MTEFRGTKPVNRAKMYSPDVLELYNSAIANFDKSARPAPQPEFKEFVPSRDEVVLEDTTIKPAPPDMARFVVESTGEGVNLEYKLRSALRKMTPHSLDSVSARIVLDLVSAREPITCVVPDITDRQRKFIWEPLVRQWWDALGDNLRDRFEQVAKVQVDTAPAEEEQEREMLFLGFSKLLTSLCKRKPFLLGNLYRAIEKKEPVFVPDGFTEQARKEWEYFLHEIWFARLDQEQHNKFASLAERQEAYADIELLYKELKEKKAELKKLTGITGALRGFLDRDTDGRRKILQERIEQLKTEIAELESSHFVDEALDIVNSDLFVFGERAGVDARVETAHKALHADGTTFLKLHGLDVAVPPAIEGWLLKSVAERAAQEVKMGADGSSEGNVSIDQMSMKHRKINEFGRLELDRESFAIAIESKLIEEMSASLVRGESLKDAVGQEPIKSLMLAYKDTVSQLDKETHQRDARIVKFLSDMFASADYDLSQYGESGEHRLLPVEDREFVSAQLLDTTSEAFVRPSAHAHETAEHTLTQTERILRSPEKNIDAIIFEFVRKFNPGKTSAEYLRMKEEFMHQGVVHELGSKATKHFRKNGSEWIEAPIGSIIEAAQDPNESFGFRVTIIPNSTESFPGYLDVAGNGAPIYYEKRGDTVHVWNAKDAHKYMYAGHFEGKTFVEHPEKTFAYIDADGTEHKAAEFDTDIFFGAAGKVWVKQKDGWLKEVGTLVETIPDSVTFETVDGKTKTERLSIGRPAHYLTPRGEVVKFLRGRQQVVLVGRVIES